MNRIKGFFNKLAQKNREHRLVTNATKYFGYAWGTGKLLFGIFSASYFLCVSALYTYAFALAKEVFFKGRKAADRDLNMERKYYLRMCGILTIASVLYIAYMTRLFFYPSNTNYGMIFGISYACFAFTDLVISIINICKKNTAKDLLVSGIRSIGLAGALLAIAFTQIALLSFTVTDGDPSRYNAIGGITAGCGCLIICGFMLVKYFKLKPVPDSTNVTAVEGIANKR